MLSHGGNAGGLEDPLPAQKELSDRSQANAERKTKRHRVWLPQEEVDNRKKDAQQEQLIDAPFQCHIIYGARDHSEHEAEREAEKNIVLLQAQYPGL